MINGSLIQEPLSMFVTLCSGSNIARLLKKDKDIYLKLGNGELISVKAIGLVVLFFENNRTLC